MTVTLCKMIRHVREQRVVEPVQKSCLTLERIGEVLIAEECLFYRDRGAELLVGRTVYRSHSAHADLLFDQESIL